MPAIIKLNSIKVLNSRGDWTIKTYLELADGRQGWAIVPEGASKGEHEAVCLEADKSTQIIHDVLVPKLTNRDFDNQKEFDEFLINLDGTKNKSRLGGNTVISLSIAFARAANFFGPSSANALSRSITPLFNILNGGKHARNNLAFQEFMVIPAKKYQLYDCLEIGRTVYQSLKKRLEQDGFATGVGDEGGFAPEHFTVKKALHYIKECAAEHYRVGEEVFFGLDVAAGSFYKNGKYVISEEQLELTANGLRDYYLDLLKSYELIYLEDPFIEEDLASWADLTAKLGAKIMLSADDLVVTNSTLLTQAVAQKLANTVIVKPNQVGTLTETLQFVSTARRAGWAVVVSHRSGDTEDPFVADLAHFVQADFVKFGAIDRGERTAKFNRLLELSAAI
ncbi:phosphopyruvate hydratase [Patescibacteria group bacterium]|nr:phosphopyruvate hydratase [Patescibacteria group bacterium]